MRLILHSFLIIPIVFLAGCGGSIGGSTVVERWADLVVAGDFSSAEALMRGSEIGIWSWREDTSYWNRVWDGLHDYQIVKEPQQAGSSRDYIIKWAWNNGKEQCLRVQLSAHGKVTVLGDYRRCAAAE